MGPLQMAHGIFGVSSHNGFLPDKLPLQRLSSLYYQDWERIVAKLPSLIRSRKLRQEVDNLPILSTSKLQSERERQRAYLLLSFITHAYIWGGDIPSERLPPAISLPFLDVSTGLGLPPTATYAALNLWNFAPLLPNDDLSQIDNLTVLHTFTGTRDEAWFYLISVAIEARGAKIIPMMLETINAARADDSGLVTRNLLKLADCIQEIGIILERMYENCSPEVFYHQIRPFLAGSKNMIVAGLPKGVFYDEGEGKGQWRQYSGGSNAQSSLIQFFDIVLGVDHSQDHSQKRNSHGVPVGQPAKSSFLKEMRSYMPGAHRDFLEHVESIANIRDFVMTADDEVNEAYNKAVAELSAFRDIHIQIVTRYILSPSRKLPQTPSIGLNLAIASTNKTTTKQLRGTGGTDLMPFLKQSRDDTKGTRLL